jgi:regulator of replication initiation timing
VEELLEENNDIQRENQKMNKDKIAEDRVENEKRNSASDILAQARDAAKRSHEAAYTEVDSLRSTAIMSGRW